jgi:hypothetical protein
VLKIIMLSPEQLKREMQFLTLEKLFLHSVAGWSVAVSTAECI